ncbi:MAG: ribonuclease P protein component [Rhodoferax sp.]|nr:ribonuclease P protein component [Rhodoferax sp.]
MQRLKNRTQFQAVLAACTVARTSHFALHSVALPASDPALQGLFAAADAWLGAMVPKRWARRAVTRNTIKRQVYAIGQTTQPTLASAAHVVRLRFGFDRQKFPSATSDALQAAVRRELLELFGQVPAV